MTSIQELHEGWAPRVVIALTLMTGSLFIVWWLLPRDYVVVVPFGGDSTSQARNSASPSPSPADVRSDIRRTATPNVEPNNIGVTRVDLEMVDALNGNPLPNHPFIAMSHGKKYRLLHQGSTNREGRAVLENLPAGMVVIEAVRNVHHRDAALPLYLSEGHRHDARLEVPRGGKLWGKVRDDLGAPIEGAEIYLLEPKRPWKPRIGPVATTDARGRFSLRRVASRPHDFEWREDRIHPHRDRNVIIQAVFGSRRASTSAKVKDGKVGRAPDLVLKRTRRLRGRVVGTDGEPVPRAFVSASLRRLRRNSTLADGVDYTIPYGQPGFGLAPEETITATDGSFVLELLERRFSLKVQTEQGLKQTFGCPEVSINEEAYVELVLGPFATFYARLSNESGNLVEESVSVSAQTQEGQMVLAHASSPDRDGFRFCQVESDPEVLEIIEIFAHGYHPLRLEPKIAHEGSRLDLTLRRLPTLKFEFALPKDFEVSPSFNLFLSLGLCLRDPSAEVRVGRCCGVGRNEDLLIDGDAMTLGQVDVSYSMQTSRPYWLTLRNGQQTSNLGSFTPQEEPHQIDLPPHFIEKGLEQIKLARHRLEQREKSRQAHDPSSKQPTGTVILEVCDGTTEKRIAGAAIILEGPSHRSFRTNAAGFVRTSKLAAGTWTLTVSRRGYEKTAPIAVEIPAGSELDLGRLVLQPKPTYKLRLLDENGRSPEFDKSAFVQVYTDDGSKVRRFSGGAFRREEELFVLRGDLPERGFLGVATGVGFQLIPYESWSPEEIHETRLKEVHTLRVEVRGCPPDLVRAQMRLRLRSKLEGFTHESVELSPSSEGVRRFQFRVVTGAYELFLESPIFEASSQEVLFEGTSPQPLEVNLHP